MCVCVCLCLCVCHSAPHFVWATPRQSYWALVHLAYRYFIWGLNVSYLSNDFEELLLVNDRYITFLKFDDRVVVPFPLGTKMHELRFEAIVVLFFSPYLIVALASWLQHEFSACWSINSLCPRCIWKIRRWGMMQPIRNLWQPGWWFLGTNCFDVSNLKTRITLR